MRLPRAMRPRNVLSLQVAELVLLLAATSLAADTKPSPHRFIPAKGLVAYLEYEGLDAHAAAWKASAAHGVLVDAHAGKMISELVRQVLDRIVKEIPDLKLTGADLIALHDHLMHHGFVIAYREEGEASIATTYVLTGVGEKGTREGIARVIATVLGLKAGEKPSAPVRIRGRDVYTFPSKQDKPVVQPAEPQVSWWFEGNDMVLMLSTPLGKEPSPKAKREQPSLDFARLRTLVFDTIDGKEPDVTQNHVYAAAVAEGKEIKGFEPSGLFWIDPSMGASLVSALPEMPGHYTPINLPELKPITDDVRFFEIPNEVDGTPYVPCATLPDDVFTPDVDSALILAGNVPPVAKEKNEPDPLKVLGLDGIKRIVVRWGFQGKALLTDVRIEAPAPRQGVVASLEQPAFRKDHLPPLPRGTGAFVVGSFDAAGSYGKYIKLLNALDPDLAGEIPQVERAIFDATGLRGVEDLRHVGPDWLVLRLPSTESNPPMITEFDPTEYALVAGTDDPDAFGKMLDTLAARASQYLADLEKQDGKDQPGNPGVDAPVLALEQLKAPDRGYQLTSPARLVPWLNDDLKPTILVGKSHVAIATSLELAREALSAELPGGAAWTPQGELQKALECLPENLTFLAVGDPRDSSWPTLLEQLPSTCQMLAGLLGVFDADKGSTSGELLALVGIPAPGGFRFRIDPAQIPRADQVRKHLFPSVVAGTVDDRGFRLIDREAFPFACVGGKGNLKWTSSWGSKGFKQDLMLNFDLGVGH